MIGVNLIPSDVLQAQRRKRRVRLWLVAVSSVAALAALPVLWQLHQGSRLAELVRLKEARAEETVSTRSELSDAVHSLATLQERIERADALRTKRSWTGLLTLLSASLPDEVWLTSISTENPEASGSRRKAVPKKNSKDEQQPTANVLAGARRLELVGYAVGHDQLYDFMFRLKEAAAFDRIDLLKANKEKVLWSEAVRFELLCTW